MSNEQNGPPPQPITQPAMAAVVVPVAPAPVDARVAVLEAKLGTVAEDVAGLKVKVSTLDTDMSTLKTDMATVKADTAFTREETTKQTQSIKRIEDAVVPVVQTVGKAIDTPLARKILAALGVTVLVAITGYLASKGIHVEFSK